MDQVGLGQVGAGLDTERGCTELTVVRSPLTNRRELKHWDLAQEEPEAVSTIWVTLTLTSSSSRSLGGMTMEVLSGMT